MTQNQIEQLKYRLHSGVVKFSFVKKDGSVRNAMGTTNLTLISESDRPKSSTNTGPRVNFYDIQIGEWRSVSEDSEVTIHSFANIEN